MRWENSYHHLTMGFLTARGSHATQSGVRTCSFHRLLIGEMDCNIGARCQDARVRSSMNKVTAYFLSRKNGLVGLTRKRDKASPRF